MLTNQEKIEIKVRALKLAEDLEEAKSIYAFLVDGLDDDPLRVGTPSPLTRENIEKFAEEIDRELKKQRTEIDWSRPQLVKSKSGSCVVQVDGVGASKNYDSFSGKIVEGRSYLCGVGYNSDTWACDAFVYHGEIPDQKIPTAQEQRTTGLNFLEAMMAVSSGEKVRRNEWSNEEYYLVMAGLYVRNNYDKKRKFPLEDFLATDWEIV